MRNAQHERRKSHRVLFDIEDSTRSKEWKKGKARAIRLN
jgi:hypothetical protein